MEKAIEAYKAAADRHVAAVEAERAALAAYRKEQCTRPEVSLRSNDFAEWLDRIRPLDEAHTAAVYAEERAARIRKAAAYIAEQRISAAAVPIVLDVLKKYEGKPAGPKTREKAEAEISAALGERVYFTNGYYGGKIDRVRVVCEWARNDVEPIIYAAGTGCMVDENNRFCCCEIKTPDLEKLPADLEAWADEFEAAAAELEAARAAFEDAASKARRVNLGDARLKEYRITSY